LVAKDAPGEYRVRSSVISRTLGGVMAWETPDQSPEDQERTSEEPHLAPEDEPAELEAGWYTYGANGLRFYDGGDWTPHFAPAPAKTLNLSEMILAVAGGVLIAWFVIWLGAQIDPDHVYVPVKFVVDELPNALQ
jgi:hypothetical protein